MMNGWDFAGSNGWMMVAVMAIFVTAILASIWLVARGRVTHAPAGPTANDTLRERFARGEITREHFEDAKRSLD